MSTAPVRRVKASRFVIPKEHHQCYLDFKADELRVKQEHMNKSQMHYKWRDSVTLIDVELDPDKVYRIVTNLEQICFIVESDPEVSAFALKEWVVKCINSKRKIVTSSKFGKVIDINDYPHINHPAIFYHDEPKIWVYKGTDSFPDHPFILKGHVEVPRR